MEGEGVEGVRVWRVRVWRGGEDRVRMIMRSHFYFFLTILIPSHPHTLTPSHPPILTMETAESASECVATSIRRVVLLDWENFPRPISGATESACSSMERRP